MIFIWNNNSLIQNRSKHFSFNILWNIRRNIIDGHDLTYILVGVMITRLYEKNKEYDLY